MRVYLESKDKKLTLDGPATLYSLRGEDYSSGLTVDVTSPKASLDLSRLSPAVASNIRVNLSALPSTSYSYKPDLDKNVVNVFRISDGEKVATLPVFEETSKTSVIQFSDKTAALNVVEGSGSLASTAAPIAVTDTTAPVFESATVSGSKLVIHFTDANSLATTLTTAPASAFTVMNDTVANPVTNVSVQTADKTVTLTLTNPITNGQKCTVAYTDPTASDDQNAVQDNFGNDVATFSAQTVTPIYDATPPAFVSATVKDSTLVMNYSDNANSLSNLTAAASAFTVSADNVANVVTAAVADPVTNTVTLTLTTPIRPFQNVSVAYTDPSTANDTNAVQDAVGNDAASLIPQTVKNNTVDATAPVFASATVVGDMVTLNYTEANFLGNTAPDKSAFTVLTGDTKMTSKTAADATPDPVLNTFIVPAEKKVLLQLANPVAEKQFVQLGYAAPASGGIQDASGNGALSFFTATDSTPAVLTVNSSKDTTPPSLVSAVANGQSIVMTFNEPLTTTKTADPSAFSITSGTGITAASYSVGSVTVDTTSKTTVTLGLKTPVAGSADITLNYTAPSPALADATNSAIQDTLGNDALSIKAQVLKSNPSNVSTYSSLAFENKTINDTLAPVYTSAVINNNSLVMNFTDESNLNSIAPDKSLFTVTVGTSTPAVTIPINVASVDAVNKKVILTLDKAVDSGSTISVAYAPPASTATTAQIQDIFGNKGISFTKSTATSADAFTNSTPDTVGPIFASATVTDATLTITYTDANNLSIPSDLTGFASRFSIQNATTSQLNSALNAVVNSTAKTVTLALANPVATNQVVTVAYTKPASADLGTKALSDNLTTPNYAPTFDGQAVTNNTTTTKSGKYVKDLGDDDFARDVVLNSNGKILVAGNSAGNFELARFSNVNGWKDNSFNTANTTFGGNDEGQAIALDSSGNILVAGYTQKYVGGVATSDFALARYTSTGTLDTAFDTDGKVTTDISGTKSTDLAFAIAVQPAVTSANPTPEKILVGGSSDGHFALARYTAAGVLDTTFDTDGKVTTAIGTNDSISSLAVQSDGKIVAAGTSDGNFAVVRYTSAGVLDTAFGNSDGSGAFTGKTTTDIVTSPSSSTDTTHGVAIQADGKILVAGTTTNTTNNGDFALVRYNADGSLDNTFGALTAPNATTHTGIKTLDISGSNSTDSAYKVLLQTDGKILVGGTTQTSAGTSDFAVARYNADGSLDTTFGALATGSTTTHTGIATVDMGTTHDYAYSMALQGDGKIVLVGTADNTTVDFALARFNMDGSLDNSFGV